MAIVGLKSVSTRTLVISGCILILAGWLRLEGLTRGDGPTGTAASQNFYHFHPDEYTVIKAAISLADPLTPEVTAYGMLPMYLLRGTLELVGVSGVPTLSLSETETKRRVYHIARATSVAVSWLAVVGVLLIGLRFFCEARALIATAIVAVAPVSIQQAHFYTVDDLFLLCMVAATFAVLAALETMREKWFVLAGLFIGLTASVRFSGLLLGAVAAAALLMQMRQRQPDAVPVVLRRALAFRGVWLAVLTTALTVILLQPYLLFNTDVLSGESPNPNTVDMNLALTVARGEVLQPWTLADVDTIPFWHHWSSLWPQSVGWPMTVLLAAALVCGLCRFTNPRIAFLTLWCVAYFALIGSLHTKHVRYLLPMLPGLAILSAEVVLLLWRQASRPALRWTGIALAAGAGIHAAAYGIAFAGIYGDVDSRLRANQWLSRNAPAGAVVGVESGGFSMAPLIDGGRYPKVTMKVSSLFYQTPYMLCRNQVEFFRNRMRHLDYMAIAHVNRHAQFTRAPQLFPVIAAVYERLVEGQLGFEVVERFKSSPRLLGLGFDEEGAEPSFVGYDHPTVSVLKLTDRETLDRAFLEMEAALDRESACIDDDLVAVADYLQQDDAEGARQAVESILCDHPEAKLAHRLAAETYHRVGDTAGEKRAWRHYNPATATGHTSFVRNVDSRHGIPGASALSLVALGIHDLAVVDLTREASARRLSPEKSRDMAKTYLVVASKLFNMGLQSQAATVCQLSLTIHPTATAYNVLAKASFNAGEFQEAVASWEESLKLDPAQPSAHQDAGVVSLHKLGDYSRAVFHLRRAVELDKGLASQLQGSIDLASSRLENSAGR